MRGNFRMLRRTVEKRRNLYYNFLENEKILTKLYLCTVRFIKQYIIISLGVDDMKIFNRMKSMISVLLCTALLSGCAALSLPLGERKNSSSEGNTASEENMSSAESAASAESSFGAGSLAGKFDKEFEKQNENSSANENEKDIEIAYSVIAENEEIKSLLESGMVIAYAGYTENIDGRECYVFVLGTDHEDHIVNEYFYGVCDNLIYVYDVLDDSWNAV